MNKEMIIDPEIKARFELLAEADTLDYIYIADTVDAECCAEEHECALEYRAARLLRGYLDSLELIAALLEFFSESR